MRKKSPCLNEKAGGLFCKWKMHHRIGRDKKVHTNENVKNSETKGMDNSETEEA